MGGVSLRPLKTADAPRLFELVTANRRELNTFWWAAETRSVADSQGFIREVQNAEMENGAPTRGICIDDELHGIAALHRIDWEKRRSLMGYWLDRGQSGRGYTTKAVRMLIDEAFTALPLEEVRISACIDNQASLGVARKLGFSLLEITDTPTWQTEEKMDTAIYSLSRADLYGLQPVSQPV